MARSSLAPGVVPAALGAGHLVPATASAERPAWPVPLAINMGNGK